MTSYDSYEYENPISVATSSQLRTAILKFVGTSWKALKWRRRFHRQGKWIEPHLCTASLFTRKWLKPQTQIVKVETICVFDSSLAPHNAVHKGASQWNFSTRPEPLLSLISTANQSQYAFSEK